MFYKIRNWFARKRSKPVKLSPEQLADMQVYSKHVWPTPVKELELGDRVWVMAPGHVPKNGTVIKLRKVNAGVPFWLVQYGESANQSVVVHPGEPAFVQKDDLLMYNLGEAWRRIARLYNNLQSAVGDVDTVAAYTEQRVNNTKLEIKFLESQLGKHVPYKEVV